MHASRPGLAPTAGRSRPGAPAPRPGRRRLTCGRSPTRCASVLLCPRQQDGGGRAAPPRASLPAPLAIGWPRSARGRGGPSALLLGRRDSPRRLPEGAGSAAGRGGGAGGVLAASTLDSRSSRFFPARGFVGVRDFPRQHRNSLQQTGKRSPSQMDGQTDGWKSGRGRWVKGWL